MLDKTINQKFFDYWEHKDVVIHCKTQEQAVILCKLMKRHNTTWAYTGAVIGPSWETFRDQTCYCFNKGGIGDVNFFQQNGYEILEFQDFINACEEPKRVNKDFIMFWGGKKVVMHCKTKEHAKKFLEYVDCTLLTKMRVNTWDKFKEDTCYAFNEGDVNTLEFYRNRGYKVLEYDDYLPSCTVNKTEREHQKNKSILNILDSIKKLIALIEALLKQEENKNV